jgi:hypothetical protein
MRIDHDSARHAVKRLALKNYVMECPSPPSRSTASLAVAVAAAVRPGFVLASRLSEDPASRRPGIAQARQTGSVCRDGSVGT